MKPSGLVAALGALILLVAGGVPGARGQAGEESAGEFNRRAQAERDAYMRQREAERAPLLAEQSQSFPVTATQSEPIQTGRDRFGSDPAQHGLEVAPQTPEQPSPPEEGQGLALEMETESAGAIRSRAAIYEPARAVPIEGPNEAANTTMFLGIIGIGLGCYLIPTIVAFSRGHRYRWPIMAFNIGAGWSGIGWIWTLVWAVWPKETALIEPVVGSEPDRPKSS